MCHNKQSFWRSVIHLHLPIQKIIAKTDKNRNKIENSGDKVPFQTTLI